MKNNEQRLLEMMGNLNPDFKKNDDDLDETIGTEHNFAGALGDSYEDGA